MKVLHRLRDFTVASAVIGSALLSAPPAMAGDVSAAKQEAAIRAVLQASPSDDQLRRMSDVDLVEAAVRCVAIEGSTFCLHRGWGDNTKRVALDAARDVRTAAAYEADMPTHVALREWSRLPRAQRIEQERRQLEEAYAAVGKVQLYEHLVLGEPLPKDFATKHPQFAKMLDKARSAEASREPRALTVEDGPSISECWDCDAIMQDINKFKKQDETWNCGAASLQALVWNSPGNGYYQSQYYWEGVLGIRQSHSTWVVTLKDKINQYTNWDNYAGSYIVVGILNWNEEDYRRLFRAHIGTARAPVQLHPKLIKGETTSYYPGNTSGHYNVGNGYDFTPGSDRILVYEPAGGAPFGNIYPYKLTSDKTFYIRKAQLANSNQRNIIY